MGFFEGGGGVNLIGNLKKWIAQRGLFGRGGGRLGESVLKRGLESVFEKFWFGF